MDEREVQLTLVVSDVGFGIDVDFFVGIQGNQYWANESLNDL